MNIDPNAPAFPVQGVPEYSPEGMPLNPWANGWAHNPQPGMSIRATMAMHLATGILAGGMADGSSLTSSSYQPVAKSAVAMADALLDELNSQATAPTCSACGGRITHGIDGACSFACAMETRIKPKSRP